jgi:hypothetical protein
MPQIVNMPTFEVHIDEDDRMSGRPRIGEVLLSPVADSRFLVISPGTAVSLPTMDGVPLLRGTRRASGPATQSEGEWQLKGGRRYVDSVTGLRLLCIWPGPGRLHVEGRALTMERDSRDRLVPVQIHAGCRSSRATVRCSANGSAIGF